MQTTNKTTSAKKYTVVSDSFVGPLMPNQIRESEIEIKNFNYDEIDYSQLSINQTEEEKIANSKAKEYIQKNADANGDGVVDEVDLSIYDRFDTNPGLGSVVDLTGDGKINSEDKSLLEKYLFDAPNLSSYLSDYTLLEYEKVVEKEQYESALSAINDKISSLDKELSKYDYNKDGKVDENDINLIIANYDISKSMSLNVEFSDDLLLKNQKTGVNYDVNGDGIVDSKDVDELNNKIKELSDLKNSVTLIESFIPSIESEIEKYSYYKTLVSSDFESFTLNYSNSSYKELCDYLQERGCNETALNEYINNLTSYVNSSEYNEEEFKKKYAGFEPVFDEFGFCQGMYFDGLAIVEYLKGNYDQVNNLEYFDSLSGYDRFYKYMTEEQKNIFHYLYSKKGKDAALDFANSISDDLNKAEGYEKAMGFISTLEFDENGNLSDDSAEKVRNMMKSGATGTLTGLEDYIVGARDAMLETITGESSYTVWDYQKMYTAALLTQLSSDGIEEVSYEYGQVFGNMILPILISEYATLGLSTSFLPAKATSAIGKGISFASMMPSSYGNSLHQYQASGYDSSSARACALMVSLSDSAAEAVFGSVLGKGSGNILIDICKEGIEEGGSSSLQMGFEYMILGKEVTIEEANEEIGKSALFGMLMAGMMSGKSMISANMYSENINIDCEKALEYIANNPKATVEDVVKNAASNTDVEFGIDSETGAVVENNFSLDNDVALLTSIIDIDDISAIMLIEKMNEGTLAAQTKFNSFFKAFREHSVFHTSYVTEYALDFVTNVSDVNVDEVKYGALCHDLGMKGGIACVDNEFVFIDEVTTLSDKAIENNWSLDRYKSELARKNHPLNSALTVLTTDVVPKDVNKDVVALLAMSHSKSTSGITNIGDANQWNACIDKLNSALIEYNSQNRSNYTIDVKGLKEKIANQDSFAMLQKEAMAIRDADAMSKVAISASGCTILQTNGESKIIYLNKRTSYNDDVSADYKSEIIDEGITDLLISEDGTTEKLDVNDSGQAFSIKIHVGESNVSFKSSYNEQNNSYMASVDLIDENLSPNCTFSAITERIEEVATYGNCSKREFIIKLPKEAQGTKLGDKYIKMLDDYKQKQRNKTPSKEFYSGDATNGMVRIEWY